MSHHFADIAFTEDVKLAQEQYGSRPNNARLQDNFGPNHILSERETDFIAERDSFYLATVGKTGWPYVQHRGGPPGFLKVIRTDQLAYADFRGNTQLISVGNISGDDRCSLILMDYTKRRRLKIFGHMRVEDARSVSTGALSHVALPEHRPHVVERIVTIDVAAFDWNCPQHITPRYTEQEFAAKAEPA